MIELEKFRKKVFVEMNWKMGDSYWLLLFNKLMQHKKNKNNNKKQQQQNKKTQNQNHD